MMIPPEIRSLVAVMLIAGMSTQAPAQYVERRGGESTLHGQITQLDGAGVVVESDLGARHFVPWDRVRRVVDPGRQPDIDRYEETAMMLWRARSRVERHDPTLAEPLFERLFEQYRGRTHETALVVAEGLLRCRLSRGAHALAVIPALEAIRIRRAGVTTTSYSQLPDLISDEYALCTLLAPFWLESPVLDRVYEEVAAYEGYGDATVQALARLYAESLRRVVAPQDAPIASDIGADSEPPVHPGTRLLADVLALQSDDSDLRGRTRDRMLGGLQRMPRFARSWTRFFVGLSLLGESGLVRRQRGMMHMLHLPAVYASEQKYLSGVALRIVAEALEESGDVQAAERLRLDLASRYPYHPVRYAAVEELGLPRYSDHDKEQG